MDQNNKGGNEPALSAVVSGVAQDAERLLRQHVDLLRAEIGQELNRAKAAACSLGTGAGLVALGGLFSSLMVVHGLHRATRLPLWACFGLAGGLAGAAGVGLLTVGREQLAGIRLTPTQTTEALREDASWLKERVAAAT